MGAFFIPKAAAPARRTGGTAKRVEATVKTAEAGMHNDYRERQSIVGEELIKPVETARDVHGVSIAIMRRVQKFQSNLRPDFL